MKKCGDGKNKKKKKELKKKKNGPPPPPHPMVILQVTQTILFTTSEEIHARKHESYLSARMQLNKMFTVTLASHK